MNQVDIIFAYLFLKPEWFIYHLTSIKHPHERRVLFIYLIWFTHGSLSSLKTVLLRVRVNVQNVLSVNDLFTMMGKC